MVASWIPFWRRQVDKLDSLGTRVDERAWRATSRGQDLRALVAPLGKTNTLFLLIAALGAGGQRRRATAGWVGLALAGTAIAIIKPLVGRKRPKGTKGSFPSGDTTAIAATATAIATSTAEATAGGMLVLGVAAGRVLDRQHHPSDVLAGSVLGLLLGQLAKDLATRVPVPTSRSFAQVTLLAAIPSVIGYLRRSSHRHRVEMMVLLPPLALAAASRWWTVADREERLPEWLSATSTPERRLPLTNAAYAATLAVWLLPWRHIRPLVTGMAVTTVLSERESARLEARKRPRRAHAVRRLGLGLVITQVLATLAFLAHWIHAGEPPPSRIETKHR
ncbi:MAG: phosphatase PAP2 family protein [Acidobacteriota bacterium]